MTGILGTDKIYRALYHAGRNYFSVPYYGFIQGHDYINDNKIKRIKSLVGVNDDELIREFEAEFARLIGEGEAVSFAAGRMGFYALMQSLSISKGDEVVLQGATCSVMVNAVLRTGATPVYADIGCNTFGSSVDAIEKVLSSRTRIIVAQHSFGIPCDIVPISELARKKGIFLLEDCALTVGSSIEGTVCGNFGNAALFSTDHSKPINTITGGLIYSNDKHILENIRNIQARSASFSMRKQKALWHQFVLERKYCIPQRYGRFRLAQLIYSKLLGITRNAFANDDYGTEFLYNYPFPAQIPAFLAAVGLIEIERWKSTAYIRHDILTKFVSVIEESCGSVLPSVYHDTTREIIPLRIAWAPVNGPNIRERLTNIIDVDGIWFMDPVIASREPLENFKYTQGSCPVSERLGRDMINLPCNIPCEWVDTLSEAIRKKLN